MSKGDKEPFFTLNRTLLLGLLVIILLALVKYSFVPLLSRRIISTPDTTAAIKDQQDQQAKRPRSRVSDATRQKVRDVYAKQAQPMSFVENKGQENAIVKYSAQGQDYAIYFTQNEAVLAFTQQVGSGSSGPTTPSSEQNRSVSGTSKPIQGVALILRFLGVNPNAKLQGLNRTWIKINYFVGDDPDSWHTGVSSYGQVVYQSLWPGINLAFRGENGQLKYDFILKPGSNINNIQLTYEGDRGLSLDKAGNLLVKIPIGELVDKKPVSYQFIGKKRHLVETAFVLRQVGGKNVFGFKVIKGYDPKYPLVIDPELACPNR